MASGKGGSSAGEPPAGVAWTKGAAHGQLGSTGGGLNVVAIPTELRDGEQWVAWRFGERDGKRTKVPYRPDGKRASATNPGTWTRFETAQGIGAASVGYVFALEDPYTGVDLDDCVNDAGDIHPDARRIVDELRSYTELSPSGHGLHILVRAELTGSRNRTGKTAWGGVFEVYDRDRFFCVTGNAIAGLEIEPRQAELDALVSRIFPASANGRPRRTGCRTAAAAGADTEPRAPEAVAQAPAVRGPALAPG